MNETETEKLPEKKMQSTTSLKATNTGMLIGKNLPEQYKLAEAYCKSGLLPKMYDTPAKVLTAMQYAYELGLKPLSAMRQICIINGTPAIFGDLPLAIVRQSGLLEYIKEYLLDKDGEFITVKNKNINAEPWGAICIVKRKGDPDEIERTFTHREAEKAQLLNKDVWKKYEKTMLKYRSRGSALHDAFPDVLAGMAIAEYHFNDLPKDENEVVVATSEEVKEDLDKTMSDLKIELLNSVKNVCKLITENDPTFNEARKVQYFNEHLKTTEIGFATEANLEDLLKALNRRVEVLNFEKNNPEVKDDKPLKERYKCSDCGSDGDKEQFMKGEDKVECPGCGSDKIEVV